MIESQDDETKVLCTIKVRESTLKAWKQFALDNDTTVTQTIKDAMKEYIAKGNK